MTTINRMTTWQKATALVPLALLSGAWTASLAVTSAAADSEDAPKLPDGTTMPTEAIEQPANITAPGVIAPGVPKGKADEIIKDASTNGIPAAALSAYQRAAQVIGTADPSCNIEWPLIAAIGRVESDHGRYGGNVLTAEGVSKPGIYGIPLDGSNGTQKISDTDAGQYDNDKVYDRAVGPMQFIPSTWSVVGVDGDGDGKRNPQDLDDAALATAVYLCSGDEDLSTAAGQKAAVYRYNHSNDYVNLVLSIMKAYASGDYSAVPTSSTGTTTFTPSYGDSVFTGGTTGYVPPKKPANPPKTQGNGTVQDSGSGGGTPSSSTPDEPTTTDPAPPSTGTTTDTVPDPGQTVQDTTDTVKNTVKDTTDNVKDTVKGTVKDPGGTAGGAAGGAQDTITKAEATAQCLADGLVTGTPAFNDCVANLLG